MTEASLEARISRISAQLESVTPYLPALIQLGKTQVRHSTFLGFLGVAVVICIPICIGWVAYLHKSIAQTELEIAVLKTQMKYYETFRDIQTLKLPDGSLWNFQREGEPETSVLKPRTSLERQSTF